MLDQNRSLLYLIAVLVGIGLIVAGAFLQNTREVAIEQKAEDARADLERDCEDGDAAACFDAGLMWGQGEGGDTNHGRARELVQQACDGGHKEACEFLPMMR